jgi:hypothetical protein
VVDLFLRGENKKHTNQNSPLLLKEGWTRPRSDGVVDLFLRGENRKHTNQNSPLLLKEGCRDPGATGWLI